MKITTTYHSPNLGELRVTGTVHRAIPGTRLDEPCEPFAIIETVVVVKTGLEIPAEHISLWMLREMENELLAAAAEREQKNPEL